MRWSTWAVTMQLCTILLIEWVSSVNLVALVGWVAIGWVGGWIGNNGKWLLFGSWSLPALLLEKKHVKFFL